jgi:threonine dehydratase
MNGGAGTMLAAAVGPALVRRRRAAPAAQAGLVGLAEVLAAADRIAPHVRRTPLLRAPGSGLWVKCENQQPTGSFKVRGAVNAVSTVEGAVVAQSSGNHGQAVAYAGARYGVAVTVVVPETAPAPKVAAIRRHGAAVVTVPPALREQVTVDLAARTGAVLVRSDALPVIAGQGTVGLEIARDLPEVDVVLVPVGNGGLLAGVAAAVRALHPRAAVIGVEPVLAADAAQSLRMGERVSWPVEATYRTVADGLRLSSLGPRAWEHVRRYVDDIVTVPEDSIRAAVDLLLSDLGLVAEPSGAVAAAAYLFHADALPGGTTVAVLSGGNVAADTSRALLTPAVLV